MEKINLSPEQQKQTAEYLSINTDGASIDEAQALIDSEIGKNFNTKVVEVITVGQIGRFNKFVISKFPLGDQRYLIMGVGRNRFRDRSTTIPLGHIHVLEKMANQTINPMVDRAKSHIGETKDLDVDRDMYVHQLAPFEISGGVIEVDKEKRAARIFGMSKGYGGYSYQDISLVEDELKKVLDVDKISIESSGHYEDKDVQDL
jgi:hypothetical protein